MLSPTCCNLLSTLNILEVLQASFKNNFDVFLPTVKMVRAKTVQEKALHSTSPAHRHISTSTLSHTRWKIQGESVNYCGHKSFLAASDL